MSYKLFLDDNRMPPDDEWIVVRSYKAFVSYIMQHGPPEVVSFDYQLGGVKNGYDAALWMVRNCIRPRKWFVHSSSAYGRRRISELLSSNYGF